MVAAAADHHHPFLKKINTKQQQLLLQPGGLPACLVACFNQRLGNAAWQKSISKINRSIDTLSSTTTLAFDVHGLLMLIDR